MSAESAGVDFRDIFSPDVEKIETERYPNPLVYKYYSEERRDFFELWRVRFSQKTALNDPFELTARWREFATKSTREMFGAALREFLVKRYNDQESIVKIFQQQMQNRNILISRQEALMLIEREPLRTALREQIKRFHEDIPLVTDAKMHRWNEEVENMISAYGIFSLSETLEDETMWGLYANSGRGFVVAFDAEHPFFCARTASGDSKNLLRKVIYSDEDVADFFQNPYMLFLGKSTKWQFEREWRLLKRLSECDQSQAIPELYTKRVPIESVREIIFGYNYDESARREDSERIFSSSNSIRIRKAIVDLKARKIRIN